jgi:hypothetical protein
MLQYFKTLGLEIDKHGLMPIGGRLLLIFRVPPWFVALKLLLMTSFVLLLDTSASAVSEDAGSSSIPHLVSHRSTIFFQLLGKRSYSLVRDEESSSVYTVQELYPEMSRASQFHTTKRPSLADHILSKRARAELRAQSCLEYRECIHGIA